MSWFRLNIMPLIVRVFWLVAWTSLGISAHSKACGEAPSWTFSDLNITTLDDVGENGTATFNFTYDLTNQTESLACPLHANYRCTITGTKNDDSIVIDVQMGTLGKLYASVRQVLACGDSGSYVPLCK